MPTLPWTPTATPPPAEVFVMASRLELRQFRSVPAFLAAALSIRRQMLHAPGCLGLSLVTLPLTRTFWTLSAWTSPDALTAAVAACPHADVVRTLRPRLRGSQFVTWTAPAATLPLSWSEAFSRLEHLTPQAAA